MRVVFDDPVATAPGAGALVSFRSKACRARYAKVKRFVFKVRRFHLNRQMIDAETFVQFRAQLF